MDIILWIKEIGTIAPSVLGLVLAYLVYVSNKPRLGISLLILNQEIAKKMKKDISPSKSGLFLFVEIWNTSRLPVRIRFLQDEKKGLILPFLDDDKSLNGYLLKEAGVPFKYLQPLDSNFINRIRKSKKLSVLDSGGEEHKVPYKQLKRMKDFLEKKANK